MVKQGRELVVPDVVPACFVNARTRQVGDVIPERGLHLRVPAELRLDQVQRGHMLPAQSDPPRRHKRPEDVVPGRHLGFPVLALERDQDREGRAHQRGEEHG